MRIDSNFRDYYDAVQATGQDQTLVYRRYPREVEATGEFGIPYGGVNFSRYTRRSTASPRMYHEHTTVGFCGRFHRATRVQKPGLPLTSKVCYTVDQVDSWVEAHYAGLDRDGYYKENHKPKFEWCFDERRSSMERFFDESTRPYDKHLGLFEAAGSPLFTCVTRRDPIENNSKNYLVFDSGLKEWEFFRVFDPYQAFQELSTYLGNQAAPRKPIPKTDDLTLLESQGFDKRFSFRKDPTSTKRRGKQ